MSVGLKQMMQGLQLCHGDGGTSLFSANHQDLGHTEGWVALYTIRTLVPKMVFQMARFLSGMNNWVSGDA